MQFLKFLSIMDPEIIPERSKLHLASWDGEVHPRDVYLRGTFDEWQRWQTRRNFSRALVISLINLEDPQKWLFAGVHDSRGVKWLEDCKRNYYQLEERKSCSEMNGRLIISFSRPGRQPYLNAETWADKMVIEEIRPKRYSISDFPGFKCVKLMKADLDLIFCQGLTSWRTALSSVAGVYVILDTKTGKLYVGSACGEGGIWQRWCQYATSGHGDNVELKRLLETEGPKRSGDFQFSILETAGMDASKEDIRQRENHWKDVLLTRRFGLNAN